MPDLLHSIPLLLLCFGDQPLKLNASTSSGLVPTFRIEDETIASINGDVVTILIRVKQK